MGVFKKFNHEGFFFSKIMTPLWLEINFPQKTKIKTDHDVWLLTRTLYDTFIFNTLWHTLTSIKANTVNNHTQTPLLRIHFIPIHQSLADIQTVGESSYNLLINKITTRNENRRRQDYYLQYLIKMPISCLLMLCPYFRYWKLQISKL